MFLFTSTNILVEASLSAIDPTLKAPELVAATRLPLNAYLPRYKSPLTVEDALFKFRAVPPGLKFIAAPRMTPVV